MLQALVVVETDVLPLAEVQGVADPQPETLGEGVCELDRLTVKLLDIVSDGEGVEDDVGHVEMLTLTEELSLGDALGDSEGDTVPLGESDTEPHADALALLVMVSVTDDELDSLGDREGE